MTFADRGNPVQPCILLRGRFKIWCCPEIIFRRIDRFVFTQALQDIRLSVHDAMMMRINPAAVICANRCSQIQFAIPQIEASNPQQRALGERMAINSVVQGSAADLIKLAMIDLHRRLPKKFAKARMLLQIHDELVLEAPSNGAEDVAAFVAKRMEAAMDLRVPLVVQRAVSTNWIDAK